MNNNNTDSKNIDFEFDEWVKLAKNDPDAFEQKRLQVVDGLINSAPRNLRDRLRGLQWRLDHVRNRSGNAMSACLEMNRLMWDNVLGQDGLLDSMQLLTENGSPPAKKQVAQVISLNSKLAQKSG